MTAPFTSLRYPLSTDPSRGRIAVEQDYNSHVEQLMLQVLFTAPGERINRPDFGCGIRRLVFAPNSEVAASLAQVAIYQGLTQFLPNVITVADVKVVPVDAAMEIRIVYSVNTRRERRYLNVQVTA